MGAPLITVLTNSFNRRDLLRRSMESCLSQAGDVDFELLVVEDGSTDGADAVADEFAATDPRVRVVRHPRNLGLPAARNTGAREARGRWLVLLDNDDAFLPGALETIARRALAAPEGVARLMFSQRRPDGGITPQPPLTEGIIDYAGYLRWQNGIQWYYDHTTCTLVETFKELSFPTARRLEHRHDFDFHQRYLSQTCPEAVIQRFDDAPLRTGFLEPARLKREADDSSRYMLELVAAHREGLQQHAPRAWRRLTRQTALYCFLAGRRRDGAALLGQLLARQPWMPDLWTMLLFGSLGSEATTAGLKLYRRIRGREKGRI